VLPDISGLSFPQAVDALRAAIPRCYTLEALHERLQAGDAWMPSVDSMEVFIKKGWRHELEKRTDLAGHAASAALLSAQVDLLLSMREWASARETVAL
jgi:hypothetical protein